MAANYIKLWKILLDKNLKRTDLKDLANISSSTLAKLGKNDYVSMESLEKICSALQCNVGDIVDFNFEA